MKMNLASKMVDTTLVTTTLDTTQNFFIHVHSKHFQRQKIWIRRECLIQRGKLLSKGMSYPILAETSRLELM